MKKTEFRKGLYEVAKGCYGWLQPDGSWGFSNSGLVADAGESLLIDTLYDLPKTREMLEGYRAVVPAARRIGALVNTHGNGDHYFGNQLVETPRIIASRACAQEMKQRPPSLRAEELRNWRQHGDAGRFAYENLGGKFDLENMKLVLPTEVFEDRLTLQVGAKRVELHNVGPAHTGGDTLVYLPEDKVVYTGDIIFAEAHPIIWEGPVSNWIKACDLMLSWGVEVVVPGHGPLCDLRAVQATRDYWEFLTAQARQRFDAGMPEDEAARDIALDSFRDWIDAERIVVNVNCLYREFRGDRSPANVPRLCGQMLHFRNERNRRGKP